MLPKEIKNINDNGRFILPFFFRMQRTLSKTIPNINEIKKCPVKNFL